MDTSQKSCVFCDGLINEDAASCKHCSRTQIGFLQAKDEFKTSSYVRWVPIFFTPFFILSLLLIIFTFYTPDSARVKFYFLAFFFWFFLFLNDVYLKAVIKKIHLNHTFGIKHWFFKPIQEFFHKLRSKSLFKNKFITVGYNINPPISQLVSQTQNNRKKAKINWFYSSLIILVSVFLIALSIAEAPTKNQFEEYLTTNNHQDILATKEVFNFGYIKFFGVTKEISEQNNSIKIKTDLYMASFAGYFTHNVGVYHTVPITSKKQESLELLNQLKRDLHKNHKTLDKFKPKKDKVKQPTLEAKAKNRIKDFLTDIIF